MQRAVSIAVFLSFACAAASAQDVMLAGHVTRLTVEPVGTPKCPSTCPALVTQNPDGSRRVCIPMDTACETLEVTVDRVYLGKAGATRTFTARSGEFGQRFQATSETVIVSQEAKSVHWAPVLVQDGQSFVDPKRLWKFGGLPASAPGDGRLVPLDEVLARLGVRP